MDIVRLGHALGAEVRGIDITRTLKPGDVDAIRNAWHVHHVIVFRDIDWTPEQHMAFAGQFGDLDVHDATPHDRLEGYPELLEITNKPKGNQPSQTRAAGRNWHSDYSYTSQPAASSMLHCTEKPSVGGDTMFCNMVRAYDELTERMKTLVGDLQSVYDFSLVAGVDAREPEKLAELLRINPPIAHPCVRTHDESGARALYVSERTSHFDGMSRAESSPIIDYLCRHATRPQNVYRHQWRVGDLVCWDNRAVMHMALGDFDETESRHMLRATIRGLPSGYVVAPAA
jgi:taurine dioxygenase